MTILIDDTTATAFLTAPVREGWFEGDPPIEVRADLRAADVTEDDVALLPLPEATLLTRTHVIDRSVAIVHDGVGMVAMWTPARPDEIEGPVVCLRDVGASGEALVRALLKPFFGIEATKIAPRDDPPADAQVIITEGAEALAPSESGFREDLARSWFIMTGKPFVSHVTVIGVRALARDGDEQLAALKKAVETGWERRRDVRRMIREQSGIESEPLAEVTNRMRFLMEPDDQEPARMLAERGTWGTDYGRTLPAYRDQLRRVESEGETA
ncbi:MAG TPA: MqnA/MqnD/SBP family protein [Thermomicrobiales bacterium]|nr:MqnA/MqnD/SBP family protein [Thermomicrobiales bacterium]